MSGKKRDKEDIAERIFRSIDEATEEEWNRAVQREKDKEIMQAEKLARALKEQKEREDEGAD